MSQLMQLELSSPAAEVISGQARLARLVLDASGESLAIAVVGEYQDGAAFARAVTSKVLRCLPQDLGYACHTFGALLVADYLAWSASGKIPSAWQPPLGGVALGPAFTIDAEDSEGVVNAALDRCALFAGKGGPSPIQTDDAALRPVHEARFAKSVREEVLSVAPSLAHGFNRNFSLTGSPSGFSIDYIGHAYATCYAAINPKSKSTVRLKTASAALWRLARARDAFGFATPECIELTAWIPAPGLPIYSTSEYLIVRDTLDELKEQAKREDLQVFPAYDAHRACGRLLNEEVTALN